jgi:spectinomycin phosphotransferase
MYIGGGQFVNHRSPEQETALFYQGYGLAQPDSITLAYYRYERIVQDIAAYCEQILLTSGDSADRSNGLRQLMSQFEPGGIVEITCRLESG